MDGVDIGSIDLSNNQGHQDSLGSDVLGAINPMFEYVLGADDISDLYINYVPTKVGKHTLTAVYEGTTIYKASNSTTSFDVFDSNTVETSIIASNVNVTYSAGSYYTIKVYGTDGKLADGAKVIITVKGKTFKTLTTTNGVAKFKVSNAPGTYKMDITALGKSVTKTLTVKHLLKLKSVKVKKSAKKLVLTATLGKINKKYLKNKKITFRFNGKKYTAKTNKKGVAKVTIKSSVLKKLKVGKKSNLSGNISEGYCQENCKS